MKNRTKWLIKNIKPKIDNFALPIDQDILRILASRGITNKKDIIKFLNPKIEDMDNPTNLVDMLKSIERLKIAIQNNENIWIYGDYDVDGITSTSILYLGFKELGFENIHYYIPLRDEGYGLNKEAIKSIKDEGADIIITVDCGITSYNEIKYANSLGIDTIITDHHNLASPIVPEAYAVINPKRLENIYDFDNLAGVGTAFMLLWQLFKEYNKEDEVFKYLDLVALGTVADVVPLVQENRIIVKYGLEQLNRSVHLGLSRLIDILFANKPEGYVINSGDIGFVIAPVFNAAGRLQDAKSVVRLLISDNISEIDLIIKDLIDKNYKRKEIQEDIYNTVVERIEARDISNEYILIEHSHTFHHGVIGIVASKITDMYFKPSIIMEEKLDKGVAVASCRSLDTFNITDALHYCGELLEKFGGHSGAAGFTIKLENIEKFKKKINEYAKEKMKDEDFVKIIKIDKAIPMHKISYEFYQSLNLLKPFGFGNSTPTFLTKNIMVDNVRVIGKNKDHLSMDLKQKSFLNKNASWFNKANEMNNLNKNLFYDIVYKMNINEYNNRYYTNVIIEDMKNSKLKDDRLSYFHSLYNTSFPLKSIFYTRIDIDINKEITMKDTFDRISLYQGNTFIAKLDYNISAWLIQLSKAYNYRYIIKIEDIIKTDNHNIVNILIKQNYDFKDYSINDIKLFQNIKNNILGKNMSYNSLNKLCLSKIIKENISIVINYNDIIIKRKDNNPEIKISIEDFQPFLFTVGLYSIKKLKVKIPFITKDIKIKNNPIFRAYFDIITSIDKVNKESKYIIFDTNIIRNKEDINELIKTKATLIGLNDGKKEFSYNFFYNIEHTIHIPENVIELKKSLSNIIDTENVYIYYLPIYEKEKINNKLLNGDIIYSDKSILELL